MNREDINVLASEAYRVADDIEDALLKDPEYVPTEEEMIHAYKVLHRASTRLIEGVNEKRENVRSVMVTIDMAARGCAALAACIASWRRNVEPYFSAFDRENNK